MQYIIVAIAAAITSGLTLFSGFGLGTLLLPVFAVFFPIDVAIAVTAIVHLLNNLLKLLLLYSHANLRVVLRFGLPAILTAAVGARVLIWFSDLRPFTSYTLGTSEFHIEPVKIVVAVLMMAFAVLEVSPRLNKLSVDQKLLPLGGMLSGFFGGVSGHQGALRSAFLLKCGLSKESFIATGVVIACTVDVSRIAVYSSRFALEFTEENTLLLLVAAISAFSGVLIGSRLIKKVTMQAVRVLVSIMLFGIALGLGSGMI